jgi:triacylglycerol lipase
MISWMENGSTEVRKCPVVLVHGWKSRPGVWKRLVPQIESASTPCWVFDHTGMGNTPIPEIAAALGDYISQMREETCYAGPVDMVCHSVGGCIARYLLEVMEREEQVRQLICLGTPNNGSSLSELFNDPEHGPQVLDSLAGVFVPHRYDPADDVIAQEVRPHSRTIAALQDAKAREDIRYRLILTANLSATPAFFPYFEGKTWMLGPEGGWQTTYAGDGIVPHTDSYLPGAGLDILPADPAGLKDHPESYCHITLPKNPEVMARVMEYLQDPATRPQGVCPGKEDGVQER